MTGRASSEETRPTASASTRLAPMIAVGLAIAAQLVMRDPIVLVHRGLAPTVELVLVAVLLLAEPTGLLSPARLPLVRYLLGAALAVSATTSAVLLVRDLVEGSRLTVGALMAEGAEVLLVVCVGFSVVFWQLDRGGPDGRQRHVAENVAFWFPQDAIREYSDEFETWQPRFLDYLYVSATNVLAFSPTDTMPLTRTAKMLMLWESLVALGTLGIVLARAINLFTT